jgi:hypothetical protein
MGELHALLYSYPLLALAQAALTLWMLIDAYRRGADYYWYWIILLFQPLGAWAYFLAIKVRDFRHGLNWPAFQRRASLAELRYQAEKVPTLASHLAFANRLMDLGDYAQAIDHVQAALKREPDHCQVLYALAVCHNELGRPADALPPLEQIVERERRWSDYQALRMLVGVRAALHDKKGALAAARDLARLSPTMEHHCLLAERLLDAGLPDEARSTLQQALETDRYAPATARRRNRPWTRRAQHMLDRLPSLAQTK